MKLAESDLEQSYFPSTRKAADMSVTYILISLTVILFFTLFLAGLERVQSASDQVVGTRTRPSQEPRAEISDTVDRKSR